jgi:hypothetical protein
MVYVTAIHLYGGSERKSISEVHWRNPSTEEVK